MDGLQVIKRLTMSYVTDWALCIGFGAGFTVLESVAHPFYRQFSLQDLTIQHPFTEHERVTTEMLLLYAFVAPAIVIVVAGVASRRDPKHLVHMSLLALTLSTTLAIFITSLVKNAVGRPRPDLLARCMPSEAASRSGLVDVNVCTSSDASQLNDGFRSFPSGHSSYSFSGLGFLSVWMAGQLGMLRPPNFTGTVFACLLPGLGAAMIAISRTMDYRHHWQDVTVGSLLGMTVAYFSYRQYFPPLRDVDSAIPYPSRAENPEAYSLTTTQDPHELA